MTGTGISYNTAATIDTANAVITSNIFKGSFKYGYPLRARGAGASVNNNVNYSLPGNENVGYLIGPTGAQVNGYNIGTNTTVVTGLTSAVQASAGQPVSAQMDKEQLKQLSKVSASAEFSSESNWYLVSIIYKKVGSSQRLVSGFKNFSEIRSLKLKSGMASADQFQLHKIILSKADKSMLVLKREDIDDASFLDFVLK
jgi:hypothetical protein